MNNKNLKTRVVLLSLGLIGTSAFFYGYFFIKNPFGSLEGIAGWCWVIYLICFSVICGGVAGLIYLFGYVRWLKPLIAPKRDL